MATHSRNKHQKSSISLETCLAGYKTCFVSKDRLVSFIVQKTKDMNMNVLPVIYESRATGKSLAQRGDMLLLKVLFI